MILTAQGISKRFGAVEALSGAQPADSGDIQIDGVPVTIRSLLASPRLVILDEPTAARGVVQTAQVLELVHRLRERGLGVIVISHNLDTVFDVADRIVVLRLGRRVATFDRRTTTREEVVGEIIGVKPHAVAA